MSGLSDFISKYGTEVDTTFQEFNALEKLLMDEEKRRKEEEEERLRLQKIQEEKEAQRKAAEVEAARVPENPTFDEIEKYMIMEESSGNKDSVNVNDDETRDVSKHGINELWIN